MRKWVWVALGVILGGTGWGLDGQSTQFRGDAQHTGVFETEGVERFGGVAWQFKTGGTVRSSAALSDGTLFVGSSDGYLYALDADSGESRWRFDSGASIASSPAVTGGLVLVGSRDGVLHGVSATSGQPRWRFETAADLPLSWGREGWDYILSSPSIANGLAYWGSGDGNVYAIDPETGEERWRFQTEGRIRSTPAVAGDLVVVGSSDGFVYALDASTGAERWRFETAGVDLNGADYGFDRRTISASPTVASGVVYIGSRDASLYALDARNGDLIWSLDENSAWIISSAAVRGDRVYSARSSSRKIRAIDRATGVEEWSAVADGFLFSSPVVVGGALYIGSSNGDIAAYDAVSGDVLWKYRTGGGIWATPVVHQGRIYVGSDDGFVYAFAAAEEGALERAVFFDETLAPVSSFGSSDQHRIVWDFFSGRGYRTLDAASLLEFLEARVSDQAPSVVVFAMDALPDGAGTVTEGTALLRRYLDSGGKVVWMGLLPEYIVRDPDSGEITGMDAGLPAALLDVDFDAYHGDVYGVTPTEAGLRWGLTSSWVGPGTTLPSEVTEVLALDEVGRAVAWVKGYGGPSGTGFVHLRPTTSLTLLSEIQRVAEYGLAGVSRDK